MSDVIHRSLQISPAVEAAENNAGAALARTNEARAANKPQVLLNSSASVSNGAIYQPPPAQETFTAVQNTISVPLVIGNRGKFLIGQAVTLYNGASAQVLSARRTILLQAAAAYFNFLSQQSLLENAKLTLSQAQSDLDVATKRLAAGAAPQLDVIKSETPVYTAQAAVLQAEGGQQSARAALNQAIGQPLDEPVSVEDVTSSPAIDFTIDTACNQAKLHSPEVSAAEDTLAAAKFNTLAQRLSRVPQAALQASDARSKDATGFSRLDTIGISITVPLDDSGLSKGQLQESQFAQSAARSNLELTNRDIQLQTTQAYLLAQAAIGQIGFYSDAAITAQSVLDKTRQGYAAGLTPVTDVITAETSLNQARIARDQAVYGAALAAENLRILIGQEPQ